MEPDEPAETSIQMSATIPTALHQRLAHAALDLQRTRSSIVSEALERWLSDHKL